MAREPTTTTMNISLPEPLKQFVDGKVSSGIYGSASEFVREAIREKLQRDVQVQDAKQQLTEKLLEGVNSGKPIPVTPGYFQRRKKAFLRRLRQNSKSR
jgi:antitoxin ParD1/3/4